MAQYQDKTQFWKGVQAEAGMIPYETPFTAKQEPPQEIPQVPSPQETPAEPAPALTAIVSGRTAPPPLSPNLAPSKPRIYKILPFIPPSLFAGSFVCLIGYGLYHSAVKEENLCREVLSSADKYDKKTIDQFCEDSCNKTQFFKEYHFLIPGT